ncbi:MAG: hypothetical protein LBV47_08435 [Bacteroidales bacterium]|nr:hypothetical protein [Bacteroidales bacterium]
MILNFNELNFILSSVKVQFYFGNAANYIMISTFSEDIDIAVIDVDSFSGNQLKMLIKLFSK